MPETRSQAAQRMAENNNAEQSSPGENESSFQAQLLDMVREQQKLLEEYKERQEQRMFEIAEKLMQENRQLHSQLQQLHGRLDESDKLIAELESTVMNVQKELDASETRLLKVTTNMLASSQEAFKHEVFERLENYVDNQEQGIQKEVINEHLHNSKAQSTKYEMQNELSQSPIPRYSFTSTRSKRNEGNESFRNKEAEMTLKGPLIPLAVRPIQKPPVFDGRTPWDAYITQFEIAAEINDWKEAEKAAFLATGLKGQATTVLSNLPTESRAHFPSLVAALESRFGNRRQAELHRMKLRSRVRRRDESLPELAEDVERLARLAYPDATVTVLETLSKDQFIDALMDDELRLRVAQARPTSLRAALGTALELESFSLAARRRSRPVRALDGPLPDKQVGSLHEETTASESRLLGELKEITNEMRNFVREVHKREQRMKSKKKCWFCDSEGHLQRECPKREQSNQNPDSSLQGNERRSSPGGGVRR